MKAIVSFRSFLIENIAINFNADTSYQSKIDCGVLKTRHLITVKKLIC
jgi:hypothetical protein